MDDQRVGRALRAIRLHRRRRQADIARAARLSQSSISRIERGHLGSLSLDALRAVAATLEATVDVGIRWRGGEVDRIIGARHTAMSERIVAVIDGVGGWQWTAEASFSAWGERGVIDVLAWHPGRGRLLVIELKTELVDPAALLAQVDRYRRLAPDIARARGWTGAGVERSARPGTVGSAASQGTVASAGAAGCADAKASAGAAGCAQMAASAATLESAQATPSAGSVGPDLVACWVVVADTSSNRARLARHRRLLRGTFPVEGRQMIGWLTDPCRPVMGLSFLPDMHGKTGIRVGPVRRVRVTPTSTVRSRSPSVTDPQGWAGHDARRRPQPGVKSQLVV